MNETARGSTRVDEHTARAFAIAHKIQDLDKVDDETVKDAASTITNRPDIVEQVTVTDNAARPKSILLADIVVDGQNHLLEVLAIEETVVDGDQVTRNEDGTVSWPVDAVEDVRNAYETLSLRLYER